MKCTAYKVIPEWDNAFKSLLGSRHEGGTQWLLFSEKDQSLLELPWLFAIWTNDLSHAKWAIYLHPHLHYTARYILWTIDRLWVRYLKKQNFYECKQLLETRLIKETSLPSGHFDSLSYGRIGLRHIGINKIASYYSHGVQCLIKVRHKMDDFSSPSLRK